MHTSRCNAYPDQTNVNYFFSNDWGGVSTPISTCDTSPYYGGAWYHYSWNREGALYWQRERDSLSDDDKTRLNWMLKRKHIARHTMLSITSSVMVAFLVFQAINWATWASQ